MPVKFSGDEQETSQNSQAAGGQQSAASPEQVRKKWDALLNVINNVSADGQGPASSQRPPLRAARELVSETGAAARASGGRQRKDWDTRHHLLFSVVNSNLQKNIRSYFGRHRETEAYGLRHDEPLRTTWQLDTPEIPPALGTLRGHYAKFNSPQGSPSAGRLPAIGDGSQSPSSTGMSRAASDPSFHTQRETGWNSRHHVIFAKDNHHYHANLREYFERPRAILW